MLGENDRFLSFTLANTALGDQANGPDDAFEVALIDASTGHSLMGGSALASPRGTGLSHSDAIVNRQVDGSEHDATGINVVTNNDAPKEVPSYATAEPAWPHKVEIGIAQRRSPSGSVSVPS